MYSCLYIFDIIHVYIISFIITKSLLQSDGTIHKANNSVNIMEKFQFILNTFITVCIKDFIIYLLNFLHSETSRLLKKISYLISHGKIGEYESLFDYGVIVQKFARDCSRNARNARNNKERPIALNSAGHFDKKKKRTRCLFIGSETGGKGRRRLSTEDKSGKRDASQKHNIS